MILKKYKGKRIKVAEKELHRFTVGKVIDLYAEGVWEWIKKNLFLRGTSGKYVVTSVRKSDSTIRVEKV